LPSEDALLFAADEIDGDASELERDAQSAGRRLVEALFRESGWISMGHG